MAFLGYLIKYGITLLITVALAGCAVFCGITLRKKKNAKEEAEVTVNATEE